jgi:hypothetical protein
MPARYLFDENIHGGLSRAVTRHNQSSPYPLDVLRVGDVEAPLRHSSDPDILRWAETEGRIVVSSDVATMPTHFRAHLAAGHSSPGLFLVLQNRSFAAVLSFLVLVAYASKPDEWRNRIEYVR